MAIVIPCYNEEEVLPETSKRLAELIQSLQDQNLIGEKNYVLFVDDGSKDATWSLIERFHKENALFKGLKLSKNFGHQHALLAGLHFSIDTEIVVSMDSDLQDDPYAVKEMIEKYHSGAEIVYGIRDDRSSDNSFKRGTATLFYRFLSLMGVETIPNHADFRLMSQKSLESLRQFKESNIYLRGMIPLVGFQADAVYYKRSKRFAGESKYNLKKMVSLAWNGISSLSIRPLRFVTTCGVIVFFVSIILSVYGIYSFLFLNTTPGWTSTVLPIYFLGGIQLLCIGLIGEYVAKIYLEVKQRPRFIIEKTIG